MLIETLVYVLKILVLMKNPNPKPGGKYTFLDHGEGPMKYGLSFCFSVSFLGIGSSVFF